MFEVEKLAEFGGIALLEAFRRAAHHANIAVAVTLADSEPPRNIFVNERLEELLGRTRQDLEQVGIWACIAPEELEALRESYARRLRGEEQPATYETTVLKPDGERVPVEIAQSQIEIDGRQVVVSFLFDLRDRRRALAALNESEQRFRHVVENAPDGVAVLRGPRVVFLNRRAAALLGMQRPEEGYGRMITEFLHPEDALRARERIMKLLASGVPFPDPAEYRSRSAEGRELVIEISSIPVELDGTPAVVAFARDVTERKAIQAKLVQADRLSALGVLSAGVAHEINNPLAYLLLNLEYLERELNKLKSPENPLDNLMIRVRDARHGAERVASIVRDLRTFARGDEGLRGPVRLSIVLEAALNIAKSEIEPRARIVRMYDEVPPVDGNANRLEQVFLNLLLNAAQAIEHGGCEHNEIRVAIRRDASRVCVEISDTGGGMTDAVMSRIFDPFFTTKPPGIGTGLGLPICQSLVRALGGDISVSSTPDRGSTFTVTLPTWQGDGHMMRTPLPVAPPPSSPRGRVMIVDDEVAVGRTLSLVLGSEHDVTVVTSGEEALSVLHHGSDTFDAVLCDLVMPGMTGIDLFQAIRDKYPDLAPRVIFMTGGLAARQPEEVLSMSNPLFEKPFDLDQIRSALRNVVVERRSQLPIAPS